LAHIAKLLLVLCVLAGSAAAFAVSEGLKVQRAAVTAVSVDKVFSPVCRCPQARATIAFKLTRSDRLSLAILGPEGEVVRTLVRGRLFGRGAHHFTWNGREDGGRLAPGGKYTPRVRLERTARTFVLPNPIEVDVTPPRIAPVSVRPRVISPDGDARSDVTRVSYRISERAHAILYVNGRREARTKFQRARDNVNWYGRRSGRPLPPGRYRLSLAAVDRAGNQSTRTPAGFVRIRYVEVAPRRQRVAAGARIRVRVSTDAKRVEYVLRRGASVVASGMSGPRLSLRGPAKRGVYVLVVEAAGHRAIAAVVVGSGDGR
jgi:flagellar hook assembly protein FlgD